MRCSLPGVERELGLKHAVGPGNRHEVGARRPAEPYRHGLQTLAWTRLQSRVVERGPSRRGSNGNARAEARDVRAALVARRIAARRAEG